MSGLTRVWTYMLLSCTAGLLLLVVVLVAVDPGTGVAESDRRVLGGAIMLVCAFGIVSALRPNWRRRIVSGGVRSGGPDSAGEDDEPLPGPPRRGHHPDCGMFASHTLTLLGKVRCAGCTGLATGAFAVALLVWLYAVEPTTLDPISGAAMVMAGLSLVALVLGTTLAGKVHPWASLLLNVLLVLGFALVSIGLLETTGELAWGLIGVVLSVLWMDTRIQLSRWNHAAVCAVCPEGCVAYGP